MSEYYELWPPLTQLRNIVNPHKLCINLAGGRPCNICEKITIATNIILDTIRKWEIIQ